MKHDQMTVLLTGACGGIGQALARQLVQAGASIYITGRDEQSLRKLKDELVQIAASHQMIVSQALDLQNDVALNNWIESLQSQRPVNVLINNAGVSRFELFENQTDKDVDLIMSLNSIVPMKLTKKLLPMLKKQQESRIVNIASTFGAIGFPGYSVYSASKFSMRGFSQALSRELSDSNVHVGCFLPRATQTAINTSSVVALNHQMKVAMDSPQVVAKALMPFLSSHKKELAIGWPEKFLVKLNSVFPALIGNAISKKLPMIKQFATQEITL